jgi:predicted permease
MPDQKYSSCPPRWAVKLLERTCPPRDREEVQGDLLELYGHWTQLYGEAVARRKYVLNVLGLLPSFANKKRFSLYPKPLHTDMLRNYFTVAVRTMMRQKAFSCINIIGLALGMACSLLVLLWVKDELSYDQFHVNGKQIYRVMATLPWDGNQTIGLTPGPLAEALQKEFPEITHAVKMTDWDLAAIITAGNVSAKEKGGRFASADFFRMFSFPLAEGNPGAVLAAPNSIVISESMARKYFGAESPVGKNIHLKAEIEADFTVTGVMRDVPQHSSKQFNYVIPFQYFENQGDWTKTWGNYVFLTYVMLHPDASREKLEAKLGQFIGAKTAGTRKRTFSLHSFTDVYLYSTFQNGKPSGGRIEYVRLFTVVALAVLVIACINFMNLATARSMKRAKEVGIRKVAGASRSTLAGQFTGEAILMTLIAIVFSLVLVEVLLPTFNTLTGKHIRLIYDASFLVTLLGLAGLTGLVAGSYPALFMSGFNPASVLKRNVAPGSSTLLLRKGLVVFQFTLSILLLTGTLVVYQQMQYIQHKHLGMDRENVISLELEGDLVKHLAAFKAQAEQSSAIQSLTTTSQIPLNIEGTSGDLHWTGKDPSKSAPVSGLLVGYHFTRTMNIPLVAGRDFSPGFATDSVNYLINEAAAAMMNFSDPVGQTITFWRGKGQIVGVVKDFHLNSLHEPIRPLIMALEAENATYVLAKAAPGKTAEAIAALKGASEKFNPAFPFEYHFLDEEFERQYKSETLVGELTKYFAVFAIFISCLGLFGLAAYTAEQRVKEIGIRKVLGASVPGIVALLSKDFLALIAIALLVAVPVAWYIMHQWLGQFTYRIGITGWVFVLTGGLALLVALLTVSFQSFKAALANPAHSLRSE